MAKRQILALGNNGFYKNEPGKPHFFPFLRDLTGKTEPKICFIPTASGDSQEYIASFYQTVSPLTRKISVLRLFKGETESLGTQLMDQDLIYVGGGNTRNMLLLWKDWGVDRILREAYESGIVLAGGSAGSVCWFEECCTDSIPGRLTAMNGLGWLKGSTCPHYDEEPLRRPGYHALLKSGELKHSGMAIQYGAGLHYVNESLQQVVASHDQRFAFEVANENGVIIETPVPAIRV